MNVNRRNFFKIFSAGVVAASGKSAIARDPKKIPKNAMGILYDATLCIGCKTCEVGCKAKNNKAPEHNLEKVFGIKNAWDASSDLSVNTLNKIMLYKSSTNKDYSFIKRACMHCADPDCVSACPVTALVKDPITGFVSYNKDACCGCRYCQVACPFNIPKFEYDKPFPQLIKCEMCRHVIAEGGIPGCCEYCPCGASIFGKVNDLLIEAHKRINHPVGSKYDYPIAELTSEKKTKKPVTKYLNYVYGENENGGTQYIMLSAIPFEKLGLPNLPSESKAVISEGIQHTLYQGMIAPIALFAALAFAAHRSLKAEEKQMEEQNV